MHEDVDDTMEEGEEEEDNRVDEIKKDLKDANDESLVFLLCWSS